MNIVSISSESKLSHFGHCRPTWLAMPDWHEPKICAPVCGFFFVFCFFALKLWSPVLFIRSHVFSSSKSTILGHVQSWRLYCNKPWDFWITTHYTFMYCSVQTALHNCTQHLSAQLFHKNTMHVLYNSSVYEQYYQNSYTRLVPWFLPLIFPWPLLIT